MPAITFSMLLSRLAVGDSMHCVGSSYPNSKLHSTLLNTDREARVIHISPQAVVLLAKSGKKHVLLPSQQYITPKPEVPSYTVAGAAGEYIVLDHVALAVPPNVADPVIWRWSKAHWDANTWGGDAANHESAPEFLYGRHMVNSGTWVYGRTENECRRKWKAVQAAQRAQSKPAAKPEVMRSIPASHVMDVRIKVRPLPPSEVKQDITYYIPSLVSRDGYTPIRRNYERAQEEAEKAHLFATAEEAKSISDLMTTICKTLREKQRV